MENTETLSLGHDSSLDGASFDYAFVETVGRIALYDDLRSAPRITEIQPAETAVYIENLASTIHRQSQEAGGAIPYTIIREVAENFIHARFKEIVVSILDHGDTIRFADHGPGIAAKEKAQKPGFSSAVEPMKSYIRGVGSGLPIVKDYLESYRGTITIEDNLGTGAVVTISVVSDDETDELDEQPAATASTTGGVVPPVPTAMPPLQPGVQPPLANGYPAPGANPLPAYPQPSPVQPAAAPQPPYPSYGGAPYGAPGAYPSYPPAFTMPRLREKEKELLKLLAVRAPLQNKDIGTLTGMAPATISTTLSDLAKKGLVESIDKQRYLSAYGQQVVSLLP